MKGFLSMNLQLKTNVSEKKLSNGSTVPEKKSLKHTKDSSMSLTQALSEFVLRPHTRDIPEKTTAVARMMLLDSLGCALAGRHAPGIVAVIDQMRAWGGQPEATVLTGKDKVPAPNAAFANSAMIHALDYDDIHRPGSLHITSIIVPTVLAGAEMADVSGREMLVALVMGVEVACRLGIVYTRRRKGVQGSGFLPTSVVGGFGAVGALARLLKLSPEETAHAMGINYAQASGNRQALYDKTLTKRLQPAFATRSALWAAILAARGVTGPLQALEGRAGLFSIYQTAEPPSCAELFEHRDKYEIERLIVKRYTSCGACHAAQEAAERLAREEELRPEDIAEVELCGISKGNLVGRPFELGKNPQVNAQFSVRYAVAYALLRGRASLQAFTDEAIRRDRQVVDLAQSIRFTQEYCAVPPPVPQKPDAPKYSLKYHAVIVGTRDGRRLQRGNYPCELYDPARVTQGDVIQKFKDCATFSGDYTSEQVEKIIASVLILQEESNILPLLNVMCLSG